MYIFSIYQKAVYLHKICFILIRLLLHHIFLLIELAHNYTYSQFTHNIYNVCIHIPIIQTDSSLCFHHSKFHVSEQLSNAQICTYASCSSM